MNGTVLSPCALTTIRLRKRFYGDFDGHSDVKQKNRTKVARINESNSKEDQAVILQFWLWRIAAIKTYRDYLGIKLLRQPMFLIILACIYTYLSSFEMASLLRSYFSIIIQKYFIQARKKRLFLTPPQILNLIRLWKIVTDRQFLVPLDQLKAKIMFSWQYTCTWSCSKQDAFYLPDPVYQS